METPTTLKQVLLEETEKTYAVAEKLFRKVDDSELDWKPLTGKNWMTLGQLLMHCANEGYGKAVQGFIKGDWGPAPTEEPDDQDAEHPLPMAEDLPYVAHVGEALKILEDDKALAIRCINEVEEADLLSKRITAPWGVLEMSLFQQLLNMLAHLAQHKGQLFYYLKLMGKEVDSVDLWGEIS
jgi:uncharacterized damage-inducible protein DinB